MGAAAWTEKRLFRRIPAAAVLEVFLIEKTNGDMRSAPKRKAESLNISAGGILLSTDIALPVGMQVGLVLDVESVYRMNPDRRIEDSRGQPPVIEAVCRVVRVKGAEEIGYEIALAFESVKDGDAEALQRLLES
jgi:c-di-GMP-binding flagellar brake protein YcgR